MPPASTLDSAAQHPQQLTPVTNLCDELLLKVELRRVEAANALAGPQQSSLGQFMTPMPTARLAAGMLERVPEHIALLDAGVGVGSLTAAFIAECLTRTTRPRSIAVTAYDIDERMVEYARETLTECVALCRSSGVQMSFTVIKGDFIMDGAMQVREDLFAGGSDRRFTHAIQNPPYRKINSNSDHRQMLASVGIETSNLYTGFLALTARMLADEGELIAITPRSFCNGPYFRSFRFDFLSLMGFERVRLFDTRDTAFKDDAVLQETIVFMARRGAAPKSVDISTSPSAESTGTLQRTVPYEQFVNVKDPEAFIHIAADDLERLVAERLNTLPCSLKELGLTVSTGRVVEFRSRQSIRPEHGVGRVPLIYPAHFKAGVVEWPLASARKPNAIDEDETTAAVLIPTGDYVLVKRFSSKEERRRVVAALFRRGTGNAQQVGFENHLNYFHRSGQGLDEVEAKGLSLFLNSTLVDSYFRQFNGHTQVNATDLRNIRYPTRDALVRLGSEMNGEMPDQRAIDRLVADVLFSNDKTDMVDPVLAKQHITDALAILKTLGFGRELLNDRSALTLLALCDLPPDKEWTLATAPMRGITQMMDWFAEHYGKRYAPNTRETVRRQTIHQFLEAGLVVQNPDDTSRPVNSAKNVYMLTPEAIEIIRKFGTEAWAYEASRLTAVLHTARVREAQQRAMTRIPLRIGDKEITLSPGGQNPLIKAIVEEFCTRYAPGRVVYIGDADEKFVHFDEDVLSSLGVEVDPHGKMPDVVVYYEEKDWLVLIEAVTSHGPVNAKRHGELRALFGASTAGLVFVTAFESRAELGRFLSDISWETEVWVADSPDHLIHFNGVRFLGPYE